MCCNLSSNCAETNRFLSHRAGVFGLHEAVVPDDIGKISGGLLGLAWARRVGEVDRVDAEPLAAMPKAFLYIVIFFFLSAVSLTCSPWTTQSCSGETRQSSPSRLCHPPRQLSIEQKRIFGLNRTTSFKKAIQVALQVACS